MSRNAAPGVGDGVLARIPFCDGQQDKRRAAPVLPPADATRARAERTLKLEIDPEAFDRVYGLRSHPIAAHQGRRVAVRVISQFGEESTKVITL